jgi:hypothetical protein
MVNIPLPYVSIACPQVFVNFFWGDRMNEHIEQTNNMAAFKVLPLK